MLVLSPSVAMAAVAAPQANSLSPTNYFKVIKNQVFTPGGKIYIPEGISIHGFYDEHPKRLAGSRTGLRLRKD